mgnify:CR=1 FL=1|jgi:antitoxin MazE
MINIMEINIIQMNNSQDVIKQQPRQGWAKAAQRAHEVGDDELLLPDVFEDELLEDWTDVQGQPSHSYRQIN